MKFNNEHDEYLWSGAVESGAISGDGDVEAPTGWFAGIDLTPDVDDDDEGKALAFYGTRWLILHESNQGFVTVLTFDTEVARNDHLRMLEQAYALWTLDVDEEVARLVLDNYLQAAIYTGVDERGRRLDERDGLTWTVAAQRRAQFDAFDFVTQNIDMIRAFLELTHRPWEQIGIDFYLTRNRMAKGFKDRRGGAPGEELHEAAVAWGPIEPMISESGELDWKEEGR